VRKFAYVHRAASDSMRTIADIGAGGDGTAFIADFDDSVDRIRSVFIFTANGDFVKRLPVSNAGGNERSVGIDARFFTVDGRNRIVFVSHEKDSVYICDTSGAIVSRFKGSDNGKEALGFPDGAGKISFITTDRENNICVVNFQVGIQVFSPLGVPLRRVAVNEMILRVPIGSEMALSNAIESYAQSAFLVGAAVDPLTGRIFALDPAGFFCVFTPDGRFITEHVLGGAFQGSPGDMIVIGKKIYIALNNGGPNPSGTIVKLTDNLP
jgi:hypothetical protein